MAATIKKQTRIYMANNFLEAFSEKSPDQPYLFIGRNTVWASPASDTFPPAPVDNDLDNIRDYKEMIALKRVSSSNIVPVIRRFDWANGQIYGEYDPSLTQPYMTENDVDYPIYVLSGVNVYKCIKCARDTNGDPVPSTDQPTSTSISIFTGSDGYQWKFMYTLSISDILNYLTSDWIPVREVNYDDGSSQWDVQQAAISGGIHRLVINDGGSGYSVSDAITIPGGSGTGFAAQVASVSVGAITGITITNPGTGYDNPDDVVSVANGVGADISVVLSPSMGHGSNPRDELWGTYVMMLCVFSGTESGNFPVGDDFRTIGLLMNPKLEALAGSNEIELVLQNYTYNDFEPSETVEIVGTSPLVTGDVVYWNRNTGQLFLTNLTNSTSTGIASNNIGAVIQSSPSGNASGTIIVAKAVTHLPATDLSYEAADIQNGSGKIVYIDYRQPVTRNADQSEEVRLVIEF